MRDRVHLKSIGVYITLLVNDTLHPAQPPSKTRGIAPAVPRFYRVDSIASPFRLTISRPPAVFKRVRNPCSRKTHVFYAENNEEKTNRSACCL